MGARGPRPQLPEVKRVTGDSGKRKKENKPAATVVVAAPGAPFVADFLGDIEKQCIEQIRAMMPPAVYSKVDGFILAAYATQWATFRQATIERQTDTRLMIPGSTGQMVTNPLIGTQMKALEKMAALGDRLGLDPKARAALSLPSEAPKSKFAGFIGGKAPH